jgi:UDP-glucose 4-epimerase
MGDHCNKVVVIGGAGFMGSHTADELTKKGYDVTVFDCVKSQWINERQKMVVGDILDVELLIEVVRNAQYVYHFAGVADISVAKQNPSQTINLNIMGVTNALEAAVQAEVDRFIYASTMYVYSSHGSFYRASKQCAETIIDAYHDAFDLDYTLLRYGSLYGRRAQKWNGLRKYVEQVVKEGKINYRGSGKERREYIHAEDAARLSVNVLDKAHKNRAITVTGHQILSSEVLIDMIFEIANVKRDVIFSSENINLDHYETTPYRYTPKNAMKLVPDEFVDIGQGILEIVEHTYESLP